MELANAVLAEANKWLGYLEKKRTTNPSEAYLLNFKANAGRDNYTIFAKWYKDYFGSTLQGEPWCAMFVSCVMRRALGTAIQQDIAPHFAGCTTGTKMFKKKGMWVDGNPQPGDIIMFRDAKDKNLIVHTGIVCKVDAKNVYTIEGNTSGGSEVIANGGEVAIKRYALAYSRIAGYARPNYAKYEKNEEGLTMTQYEELSDRIDALEQKVNAPVYNTIEELPVWAQEPIKYLVDHNLLGGVGDGKLAIKESDLRGLVVQGRMAKKLGVK